MRIYSIENTINGKVFIGKTIVDNPRGDGIWNHVKNRELKKDLKEYPRSLFKFRFICKPFHNWGLLDELYARTIANRDTIAKGYNTWEEISCFQPRDFYLSKDGEIWQGGGDWIGFCQNTRIPYLAIQDLARNRISEYQGWKLSGPYDISIEEYVEMHQLQTLLIRNVRRKAM